MTVTNKIRKITLRILAVFSASGLSVIGAGTIAGVELWQAGAMAAFIGVMDVAENLSRAYMIDGVLDVAEINSAFGGQAGGKSAAEEPSSSDTGL